MITLNYTAELVQTFVLTQFAAANLIPLVTVEDWIKCDAAYKNWNAKLN